MKKLQRIQKAFDKYISPYKSYAYIERYNDIQVEIERVEQQYEQTGYGDIHVPLAISWAEDIHPNGPEPSSVVTWIEYDSKRKILTYGLVKGGHVELSDIDFELALEFTRADSKGRFTRRLG